MLAKPPASSLRTRCLIFPLLFLMKMLKRRTGAPALPFTKVGAASRCSSPRHGQSRLPSRCWRHALTPHTFIAGTGGISVQAHARFRFFLLARKCPDTQAGSDQTTPPSLSPLMRISSVLRKSSGTCHAPCRLRPSAKVPNPDHSTRPECLPLLTYMWADILVALSLLPNILDTTLQIAPAMLAQARAKAKAKARHLERSDERQGAHQRRPEALDYSLLTTQKMESEKVRATEGPCKIRIVHRSDLAVPQHLETSAKGNQMICNGSSPWCSGTLIWRATTPVSPPMKSAKTVVMGHMIA